MALRLFPTWLVLIIAVYLTVGQISADTCSDAGSLTPDLNATAVCIKCVNTETAAGSGKKCIYDLSTITAGGSPCVADSKAGEFVSGEAHNETECHEKLDPPPTTTTTPAPTTTTPNTTTPTTTPTPVPTTTKPNTTTTTLAPTTPTTKPTLAPTTAAPNGTTTTTPIPPAPTPAPSGGGINWGSFFGGIAFTAGVSSVAYVVWRFYKARTERNYHTLSANLI